MISNDTPNPDEVPINMNQQAVFKSWWLSNSSCNIASALNARIVESPPSVADMWVNTGLFAEKKMFEQLN